MTPGRLQNAFSAPQKQPRPKIAVFVPSGHGPASGVPRTVWVPGVTIGAGRPARASAGEGTVSGLAVKNLMRQL